MAGIKYTFINFYSSMTLEIKKASFLIIWRLLHQADLTEIKNNTNEKRLQ